MTELEARLRIVNIMRGWVGHVQGSSGHKEIVDTYNSYKPLPRGYKVTYTDAWCATTVSAAAIIAGFTDIIPPECSCAEMIKNFQRIDCWEERDDYVPMIGDIIMYDWDDNGKGDNTGAPDHVGVVEKVVGSTITVIEGNKSKQVGRRLLDVDGKYIRGFCLPDYERKAYELTEEEEMDIGNLDFSKLNDNQITQLVEKMNSVLGKKEPDNWSKDARKWAESTGLIKGDQYGNKQYKKLLTKEEVVQMMYNQDKK